MEKLHLMLAIVFAVLFGLNGYAFAQIRDGAEEPQVSLAFDKAIDRIDRAGTAGVLVISLSSGEVICRSRPTDSFVPASLMKLLTSYAALKKLGPSYVFKTQAFATEPPVNGVISGDLWIKGSGDPMFVSERAVEMAQAIRDSGVRQVSGGVFADNSFFEPHSERICLDGDCVGSYNPVVSPAAIDFNMFTVRISFPAKSGKTYSTDAGLADGYVHVNGQAALTKKGGSTVRLCSVGASGNGREDFQLSGQVSARGGRAREFRFNASDPGGLFAHAMRTALERSGVKVVGAVAREGTTPVNARPIAGCESPPLSELICGLNKYSNNFMAEMLLRSLGGIVEGAPGTSEKGIAVVRQSLKQSGIPDEVATIDCGSGLSRFCRVSPATFCRLLVSAWNDNSIKEEFVSSLAVNGGQGTLRRRMGRPGLTVMGKTGTLNDVVGFAGYVTGPSGKTYAVAIILNDVRDRARARQAVDSLLEQVAFSGLK